MSPHTITFHYVEAEHMYMYDFLLYDLVRHHHGNDPDSGVARQQCNPFTAEGQFPEVYGNIVEEIENG